MPGMDITHATQATGVDAGVGDIHKAEWNAPHVGAGVVLARAIVTAAGNLGSVGNVTPADLDATNLKCAFVVPASGKVYVHIQSYGILTSGFTPYHVIRDLSNTLVFEYTCGFFSGGNQQGYREFWQLRTGLTPGASLTWKWSQRTDGGGNYVTSSDSSSAFFEIVSA